MAPFTLLPTTTTPPPSLAFLLPAMESSLSSTCHGGLVGPGLLSWSRGGNVDSSPLQFFDYFLPLATQQFSLGRQFWALNYPIERGFSRSYPLIMPQR